MTSKFATGHPTDGMNEVAAVKVFKPVLIWVMCVRMMIEIKSRRIFDSILVASILQRDQNMWDNDQ